MPKSIHERVRATLEKKERDAKRKADRAHDAKMMRLEGKGVAEEKRLAETEDYTELDLSADW